MNGKYLSPYHQYDTYTYHRVVLGRKGVGYGFTMLEKWNWWNYQEAESSLEARMFSLDEWLIEHGWTFLTEEQCQRIELLI